MPFNCERCGKEFYSETELQEHQMFEDLRALIEKQGQNARPLIEAVDRIGWEIRLASLRQDMRKDHIGFETAVKIHLGQWDQLAKFMESHRDNSKQI